MRSAFSISTCVVLAAAIPAAAQTSLPDRPVSFPPRTGIAAKGLRFSDLVGRRVRFADGKRAGRVIDLVMSPDGAPSVLVRSQGDLVTVPWPSIRLDVPEQTERVMSTTTGRRADLAGRLERFAALDSRLEPVREPVPVPAPVVTAVQTRPVYNMAQQFERGILMSTPTDRPSDLLKDRWEAHFRAPPYRPWLHGRINYPPPPHSPSN